MSGIFITTALHILHMNLDFGFGTSDKLISQEGYLYLNLTPFEPIARTFSNQGKHPVEAGVKQRRTYFGVKTKTN
jgi:hypothetical protein